jgi:hypothetical protein
MTAHYNGAPDHARQPPPHAEVAPVAGPPTVSPQVAKARSWDELWLTTQVLERLTPCLHPDEVLERLPLLTRDLFQHDAGMVATVESPAQLKLAQVYGFNGVGAALPKQIALSRLIHPWALAEGPLHVPDLLDTPLQVSDLFAHGGMRSLLSIPVGTTEDGESEVVLILADRRPGAFAAIEASTLAQFQRAVAIPLRNARQVAEHHADSHDLLIQTGRLWEIIAAATSPAGALAQLLDLALEIGDADAGTIMVVVPESDELYVRASQGMRTRALADSQLPWGTRSAAPLQHIERPLWIHGLRSQTGPPAIPGARAEGLQTYLGMPWRNLKSQNVAGLLNLYWRTSRAELNPQRMAVLESLSRAGAVLLEQSALREFGVNCDRLIAQFQAHKAQTLSLMSHQLRTPITAVSGFAQLLLRRSPDPSSPVGRYAETIQTECKRLNVLVDNVLELSRLEGVLIALRTRPFNLLSLLHELRTDPLLRDQMEGGLLAWDLPDRLPVVLGDPLRLKQALLTLLRRDDAHPVPGGRARHVTVRVVEGAGAPAVEITLDTADVVPVAESLDALLTALDLQQVIDSHLAREAELPLYAALQFLHAMGATARKEQDAGGQAHYVVTLPVLEET